MMRDPLREPRESVPVHPTRCTGSPDLVRWVTPPFVLAFTGPVAAVPEALAGLLADGTVAEVVVEPSCVVTRLGAGHRWDVDGARVRTALHASLAQPSGWVPASGASAASDDAVLFAVAREVIETVVSPYARSHGGDVSLVDARGGVITVRLRGACHGCPAARLTLRHRLERELRRRYPGFLTHDVTRSGREWSIRCHVGCDVVTAGAFTQVDLSH